MTETFQIKTYKDGIAHSAKIVVEKNVSWYKLQLIVGNNEAKGEGETIFDALTQIRHVVEPLGLLIGVNASRINAGRPYMVSGDNGDLVSVIDGETKTVNTMYALYEAELDQLATLPYQKKNFERLLNEYVKVQESLKDLKVVNKSVNKEDRNRYTPVGAGVAVILSTLYPVAFFLFTPSIFEVTNKYSINAVYVLGAWAIIGFLLYGLAITLAVENLMISKKSSATLVFAISGPFIVFTVFGLIKLTEAAAAFSDTFGVMGG